VPVRHVIQPSTRTEWHDRLDELNSLLSRVQASDNTFAQLPKDLADKLRSYFGDQLRLPPTPRENDEVIRRVMRLEDWLAQVQQTRVVSQTLPNDLAKQVDKYLAARQRRLES
jgi:alkanesulfonate monooxygenase SsuD/methylene tetrahydromethanopterin reductase-like flavin-dependent oxidoreductase (luciferase family)